MDKIIMKNMAFQSYHGALHAEKLLGQKFYIDAELSLDLTEAGQSDHLNQTVNYGKAYEIIEGIVVNERYDLLEALADKICNQVLLSFEKVNSIKLEIRKPNAPVAGLFDHFAVEIQRSRKDYE